MRSISSAGFDFLRGLSSCCGRHLELTSKESGSGVDGVNWLPNRCSRILLKRREDVAVTGEEWSAGVWRQTKVRHPGCLQEFEVTNGIVTMESGENR